jgi:hypothetical protein
MVLEEDRYSEEIIARVAALDIGNHRDGGTILFTPAEMNAWISGIKTGEFDDLAS